MLSWSKKLQKLYYGYIWEYRFWTYQQQQQNHSHSFIELNVESLIKNQPNKHPVFFREKRWWNKRNLDGRKFSSFIEFSHLFFESCWVKLTLLMLGLTPLYLMTENMTTITKFYFTLILQRRRLRRRRRFYYILCWCQFDA
jgi:hypothetical protein